jgi:hypothetical protein
MQIGICKNDSKLKILQMNFYKIKKIYIYFDQSVISQSRSFSHLENFSVGKDLYIQT